MAYDYNPLIWKDMTRVEKLAYRISEAYQKKMSRLGSFIKALPSASGKLTIEEQESRHPADRIREHKNWKYFLNLAEHYKFAPVFVPLDFMEAVFPNEKMLFPAQLSTQKSIKLYAEFRERNRMQLHDDFNIAKADCERSAKYIVRKMNIQAKDLNYETLDTFFSKPEGLFSPGFFACSHEVISPLYYSVSKSFWKAYHTWDADQKSEIISEDRLQDRAVIVRLNTRYYAYLKEIFHDDIS
jgi:hypothetical protein